MHAAAEAWLRAAAARIHDEAPRLTALDQQIGDGDHGINMDRGFSAIVAMLDGREAVPDGDDPWAPLADLLRTSGRTLISTVGGASGPLYGSAFMKAAGALAAGPGSGAEGLVAALDAATARIGELGKSTTGEKTMLDALVPATAAARAALEAGGDGAAVAAAAAEAARDGVAATVPMLATKGRASYLGERSIGHQDPGATSAAILLEVLATTLANRE